MDNLTKEQRSKNMQAIRSKDTKIELLLRRELHRRGLRYRIHVRKVFGNPDLVFVSARVVVFCDNEFWHGKNWKTSKHKIKSNTAYWHQKIENNIRRDKLVTKHLKSEGWEVLRFWGKNIEKSLKECADIIEKSVISEAKKNQ